MAYSYIRIDPSSPSIAQLALKYKDLRLSGLQQSPSSFSSTYETEAAFPTEFWESRFQILGRHTFICIHKASELDSDLDSEWVGQVTLVGQVSAADYALPEDAGQPPIRPDEDEDKWQLLSLFTLPTHRGKGLAKQLCREVFAYLKSMNGPPEIKLRLMIKPENDVAVKLYESLGFAHAGKCTLEEALRANGDAELLPSGQLDEKFTKRGGYIMVLNLQRRT